MVKNTVDSSFFKKIKLSKLEYLEFDENFSVILLDSTPFLIVEDNMCIPHLKSRGYFTLPTVIVDQGAIPYICNGANIMYAGIVGFDNEIQADDIIVVLEEKFKKEIAIGKSLILGSDFDKNKKGKAILNLHYVGDKKWNCIKV